MKKRKSKVKLSGGVRKKKSFLENQKKYKQNIKKALKDPEHNKSDETRVRFDNFSSQVSGVEGSVVYQLAARGAVTVEPGSSRSVLSETLSYWRELNLSTQFQELDRKLKKFTSLTQVQFDCGLLFTLM